MDMNDVNRVLVEGTRKRLLERPAEFPRGQSGGAVRCWPSLAEDHKRQVRILTEGTNHGSGVRGHTANGGDGRGIGRNKPNRRQSIP